MIKQTDKTQWVVCPNCNAPHPAENRNVSLLPPTQDHYFSVLLKAAIDLISVGGKEVVRAVLKKQGYSKLRQVPANLAPYLTALFIAYKAELDDLHENQLKAGERQ